MSWAYYGLTALSLAVGWGIRGNFGHEYGAMLPGALSALSIVCLAGREDWSRRAMHIALLGALGWSFGGSMSYMQVLAYTHSGHSPSVLYGFACLFVIGFLWAAMGGAGTALAATIDRERLDTMYPAMLSLFFAWLLQGVLVVPWFQSHQIKLNWYDTDWIAATLGLAVGIVMLVVRRRTDAGISLLLHMAIGWWLGFGVLVLTFGLRMTPPRGDNWAGCLGMVVGIFRYCWRWRLPEVALSTLVTGFLGGIGFAFASMLKLVEVTSQFETNWHSILEQTTGFFNGLAVAVAMAMVSRRTWLQEDSPPSSHWREVFAVFFVLVGITYLNLIKNPPEWVKQHAMERTLYALSPSAWFNIGYLAIAVAVLLVLIRQVRRPLDCMPASAVGRAQLLYIALIWWMVAGNFDRALVGFAPQRLITEGVIQINATLCTLGILLGVPPQRRTEPYPGTLPRTDLKYVIMVGLLAASLAILADWGIVRAIYGDRFAGHAALHIRFGPNATAAPKN